MFSNFSVSTKWKGHFCGHTELRNLILDKYVLAAVYEMETVFSQNIMPK